MQVQLGQKIREFRLRDNRTQTEIADALGVSPQAVSRWEMGATYPDMELLPAIANYFGTSIDGLFGFESDREKKIRDIVEMSNKEQDVEKRIPMLRAALLDFPGNEEIMYELAATLSEAGWKNLHERLDYDTDGYLVHDTGYHKDNFYWTESVRLFERLLETVTDPGIRNDAAYSLTLLYRNLGEYEKGLALADRMPPLRYSREILRADAVDGRAKCRMEGEALLELAKELANRAVYALMSKKSNYNTDFPVRLLRRVVDLIETMFDGGTMGAYHAVVTELLLYLSEHEWRCGMRDDAFATLDRALVHAKAYDALLEDEAEHPYTSPILTDVSVERWRWYPGKTAATLPDIYPVWLMPEYDDVLAEIKEDPRWEDWVERTKA